MSSQPARSNKQLTFSFLPFVFLLCTIPLLPIPYSLLPAAAQTTPDYKAKAEKLLQAGKQLIEQGNFKAALNLMVLAMLTLVISC